MILFDFPQEPSEYIRRVGRTGRAGRTGKVSILAYGKQVSIAREVVATSSSGKKIVPNVAQRTVLPTREDEYDEPIEIKKETTKRVTNRKVDFD